VTISVPPERVLLFDGATGRRIATDDAAGSWTVNRRQTEAVGYA
jgi:hypothetical protein